MDSGDRSLARVLALRVDAGRQAWEKGEGVEAEGRRAVGGATGAGRQRNGRWTWPGGELRPRAGAGSDGTSPRARLAPASFRS